MRRGRFIVPIKRFLSHYVFSSLTQRILVLNLAGLGVMVIGILYINQFRDGLVQARIESLMIQGQIISGAIAASATVETDAITIDPEKLLELQAGQSLPPGTGQLDSLHFPINPERVAPLLQRLISPTLTRARIYDREAMLILDSRHLYSRGQILRYGLPPVAAEEPGFLHKMERFLLGFFTRSDLPVYREQPGGSGTVFPEVMSALQGSPATYVRVSEQGEQIVSVAVPVQRYRAVLGVLMLSTQGGDIDKIVAAERRAILRVFGVAALVVAIMSTLLASTIANPLRRLSAAAVRVRRGVKNREEIPDFSDRQDEIGNLSVALRDMTNALYARIEAIESFAADVSHELKNPLTSLRSAVETLPLAKNERSRERLMEVIQHDVRRLDRLITDISDASRLDAELAREDATRVDLLRLVTDLVDASRDPGRNRKPVEIVVQTVKKNQPARDFYVSGHDLRLGQVLTNLIENARSFVPEDGGRILVTMGRSGRYVVLTVDDNGPGIRVEQIERIFERFYTDRPSGEAFGQNSGLGLSISRQIIEAHGGKLTAENIAGTKPGEFGGARFVVTLPAET
ncbi:two-component system, OmpR family, sensor histidine kinase ChvG [Aquamicrobium aerolatum DSM 21857]|uniref:histidine kinase n=2 Tax=Aerobium TaxID=3143707 RepID=A0A1I3NQQ6_9HYPH|nr:sensor histidine kinase [Aquamicrobium aerolatum]SFJ11621.1 two-component system, OmpR family, sensor histidine kinase ChvG [Aquamicrobium aerolatum DSM 21857]